MSHGIIYIRKSQDGTGLGPEGQLEWALAEARRLSVDVDASAAVLNQMLACGGHNQRDLYVDIGISGSLLSRPGFDAMMQRALEDESATHVFVHQRDRFARPEEPIEAMMLENQLRMAGKTLVLLNRILCPRKQG
ncbi:MAG: recombinase family protein, partial [Planctomycetota bacterium]|nr:recombinase family protein [Planctomycetota bacterium]